MLLNRLTEELNTFLLNFYLTFLYRYIFFLFCKARTKLVFSEFENIKQIYLLGICLCMCYLTSVLNNFVNTQGFTWLIGYDAYVNTCKVGNSNPL